MTIGILDIAETCIKPRRASLHALLRDIAKMARKIKLLIFPHK